jgi:hypothetical protein
MAKPKSMPASVRRGDYAMTNISTTSAALQSEAEATTVHLVDNWFDAIDIGLRERVREF